ncbi:type II 3-dehydroquinate dehydratase [Tessaracoccus sp. MC1756]|uniref:type II 3-dehydroquinate dehydratase n=1 Tax=Tessaracoccus sp. MC1756 TaxID=2760311 RepID=UPI001600C8F0|nr:type II 3-dehydroquinate dehydratase [Tessaracoccus sp. MC1756]MBB1509371.1 3-dehydroquinate dehydratase [Tessaracoccus sp. MC1756]
MRKVLVLNGPNLGRLGTRQPEIYGGMTYAGLADHLVETGEGMGLEVDVRQTEHEGQMIEWLHEAADGDLTVVLNAGAWTHYSYAIADAAALTTYVEVHISNVHAREDFRAHSVLSAKAAGIIIGCGVGGYDLALAHVAAM